MISSPALANRSFLYNSCSKSSTTSTTPTATVTKNNVEINNRRNKVVYATLDSLALKRARLPLKLAPEKTNQIKSLPSSPVSDAEVEKTILTTEIINHEIDQNYEGENNEHEEKHQQPQRSKSCCKRPSFKVNIPLNLCEQMECLKSFFVLFYFHIFFLYAFIGT